MFLSPGTGMMSIGGAGAQGLARVALKEHAQEPVTVTEVCCLCYSEKFQNYSPVY